MHYLGIILGSILAYLIGSISWSIIIVRIRKGIDIRTVGSGNAGATNTFRVLGAGYGILVVFLDAVKVPVAALLTVCLSLIPNSLFSETSYLIPAVFVLVGHCWPIYYGFKGGKAVACFIGLLFISNIWYLFIFVIVWWIVAGITRKVSVASIIAVASVIILVWFPWLHGIDAFAWHWNEANRFWLVGAPKWGWQNEWLRFDWLNYLHELTFNFQVDHHMVLHGTDLYGLVDNYDPTKLHYGMARWATGLDNTTTNPAAIAAFGTNQPKHGYNIGYAEGMLEMAICMIASIAIILLRHIPNMKRIINKQEPETFPHLTAKEKEELYKLQHQPMPSLEERRRLKDLEKKQKIELEKKKLQEKIEKINAEIAARDAKYAKKQKAKEAKEKAKADKRK